jgi:4-hydroxy-2-oxoheptanedioate aldolase
MRTAPRRIRGKLESGDKAYGIAVQLPSPEIVEAVGYAGYDFAWIDAEHGAFDFGDIRELIRAADAVGIDSLVRVAGHDPTAIQHALDLGANGIIAPDVRDVRQGDRSALISTFMRLLAESSGRPMPATAIA